MYQKENIFLQRYETKDRSTIGDMFVYKTQCYCLLKKWLLDWIISFTGYNISELHLNVHTLSQTLLMCMNGC